MSTEPGLDRYLQTLATLSENVNELTGGLADLSELVTARPTGGPWCWRHLTPEQARALADEVRDWVDWLRDRYLLEVGARVRPCWYRHPAALDDLTALYVAWRAAYTSVPVPPSDALINWHDRWLEPCVARVAKYTAKCVPEHKPPVSAVTPTDLEDFERWLAEETGSRRERLGADMVSEGTPRLLPGDETSPAWVEGRWWARPVDRLDPNDPTWTVTDHVTDRRLGHLTQSGPVDPATGEVRDGVDEAAWARRAWLAAAGMRLMAAPEPVVIHRESPPIEGEQEQTGVEEAGGGGEASA